MTQAGPDERGTRRAAGMVVPTHRPAMTSGPATDRRDYWRAYHRRRRAIDPDYRKRARERAYLHIMGRERPPLDERHHADEEMRCAACGEAWPCETFLEMRRLGR